MGEFFGGEGSTVPSASARGILRESRQNSKGYPLFNPPPPPPTQDPTLPPSTQGPTPAPTQGPTQPPSTQPYNLSLTCLEKQSYTNEGFSG